MGSNPINLFIRFLLEVAVLISTGIWAWKQFDGWLGLVLAVLLPLLLAIIWGVFAVPDDPSRSGSAPVPTNGILRLVLELCCFGFMVWVLYDLGWKNIAFAIGMIVLAHYIVSYDRVIWLLRNRRKQT